MSHKQTLHQRQVQFAQLVPRLIDEAFRLGFTVTLGECMRRAEPRPRCHSLQLAIDLNLFRDGVYLRDTADHEPLGLFWESIGGSWGGRFGDGNHYSLSWLGMR